MRCNIKNRAPLLLMETILVSVRWLVLLCLFSTIANAQSPEKSPVGLFDSDDVLTLRFSGEIRALMKDRSDDMQYHPITLSYLTMDSVKVSVPVKVKTRGHFRRTQGNCRYPPLLLNFSKGATPKNSIFENQDKLKLVTPCTDDKYVVYEYLVYKLFNLITEKSFRARLVNVIYDDSGKESSPQYGILLEDEDDMARRNNTIIIEDKLVRPEQTKRDDFLKMAVFEYLIANTDWSVQYYQNIKLIASDTMSIPSTIPYDFDHAGIVDAPYAKPAPELLLSSTRERRYRGYCVTDMSLFDETFTFFNQKKEEIYNVYTKCALLDRGYIKSTVKFLDQFYSTINDKKSVARDFGYPCDESGTGNVVIKGLKK
jgi:hypothetical protein